MLSWFCLCVHAYWQSLWDRRGHLLCPCLLQTLCPVISFLLPSSSYKGRENNHSSLTFSCQPLFSMALSLPHPVSSELKAWSLFNLSRCRSHLTPLTFYPSPCLHWALPVPFWCSIQVWANLGLIQWHRATFPALLGCFHTLHSVYLSSLPQGNEQMFVLSNLQRLYDLFAEW